jgi:hypothetical protein
MGVANRGGSISEEEAEMRRLWVLGVVTGICLLSFPGISEAQTKPAITPGFIAKVNAYCSAEESRFNKVLGQFPFSNFDPYHPDVKTLRLVGRHFEEALPLRKAIPNELKALGMPQAGKSQWGELESLAVQSDTIAISQIRVALAGNAKSFVDTVNQTTSVHNKLVSSAEKDGFAKSSPCGQVF